LRAARDARAPWNGVHVDITEFHAGRVAHHLCYETETRLSVLLRKSEPLRPRLRKTSLPESAICRGTCTFTGRNGDVGYSADAALREGRHLTFDSAVLASGCHRFPADATATPRLRFSDDRLWTWSAAIRCGERPHPSTQTYGDGLIAAITAALCRATELGADARADSSQLRRVVEYLDSLLPGR